MGKIADLLAHPDELVPILDMAIASYRASQLPKDPDLAFCFGILNSVSRSFGVVINQLPVELRTATCVFYLVLRALDTIEDDMSIPISEKVPMLKDFHEKILDPNYTASYGTKHYLKLLKGFPKVNRVLMALNETQRDIIVNNTKRMGDGMAEFIEKDVETVDDYDKYCFYVAGLVGLGLSGLFSSSGLESPDVQKEEKLAIEMGLMLQKVNIIRDYLEDIMEEPAPRMFWPKEIWGQYAEKLEDFKDPSNRTNAKKCLNHLIVDALHHIPSCFAFMSRLRHHDILRFCAIPQVMAIATAALCFDNGGVFEGVVKVRRGLTCKILQDLHDMKDVYRWFELSVDQISEKLPTAQIEQSVRKRCEMLLADVKAACVKGKAQKRVHHAPMSPIGWILPLIVLLFALLFFYFYSSFFGM